MYLLTWYVSAICSIVNDGPNKWLCQDIIVIVIPTDIIKYLGRGIGYFYLIKTTQWARPREKVTQYVISLYEQNAWLFRAAHDIIDHTPNGII